MIWQQKWLLLLCYAAFMPALSAQFAPAKFIYVDTLPVPGANWFMVDWDGDGDRDILFAATSLDNPNWPAATLYWLENDGQGQFTDPQVWEPALYQNFILGDLNGDGSPDLLFHPDPFNPDFSWRANVNGAPGDLTPIVLPSSYYDAQLIDFDGDSDLDIVQPFTWFENDGQGVFNNKYTLTQPPAADAIPDFILGDLDGDGRQDILFSVFFIANPGMTLEWLRQDPDGSFADPSTLDQTASSVNFYPFVIDLDHDGDPDVIAYFGNPDGSSSIVWYPNLGAGQFAPHAILAPGAGSDIPLQDRITDLDNDGLQDILFNTYDTLSGQSGLNWLHNLGGGQFEQRQTGVLSSNYDLKAADLDGDGAKEVIYNAQGFILARNKGDNTFFESAGLFPVAAGATSAAIADVDNDGDEDVYFTAEKNGNLGWFPNDGAGHFGRARVLDRVYEPYVYVTPYPVFCTDLDGDGLNDLMVNTGVSSYVWLGTGGGQFAAPDTFLMNDPLLSLPVLADADLDGDLDVVAAFPDTTVWYPNDGSGAFGPIIANIPASFDDASDCYGDLDGDGDRDLIVRMGEYDQNQYLTQTIHWRPNLGGGVYGPGQPIVHFPAIYYGYFSDIPACARDMDGDGDLDVTLNGVIWFENDGTGHGWTQHGTTSANGPGPDPTLYFQSQDFDRDGDVDAVNTGFSPNYPNQNSLALHLNDGLGNFPNNDWTVLLPVPSDHVSINSADFDGDGDLDIFFQRSGIIGWIENLTDVPPITARCFFDQNANGVQDSSELPMPGVGLRLDPGALLAFTDENGLAKFFVDTGAYTLGYLPVDCRLLNTDSATFAVETPYPGLPKVFGFRPDSTQRRTETQLASGPARCGFVTQFWAAVHNVGCLSQSLTYSLKLDPLVTLLSVDPPPSAMQGDSLLWQWPDPFQPGEIRYVVLQLQIPGVDHLGDTLHLTGQVWPDDNPAAVFTHHYSPVVNCAVDPNDKLVDRERVSPGYDPAASELLYTIRFQNTGTDTAFTVTLRDTLASSLNWGTFRPLGASHPYSVELSLVTGELVFHFEHILLLDSSTNELASHGFVQFAIQLQPGLPVGTVVRNEAGIYFDFNAPVMTNSAETKILFPLSTNLPGPAWQVSIQPNPNDGNFTVELSEPATQGLRFRVVDLTGRIVLEKASETGLARQCIRTGNLPAGLYFLQILSDGKFLAVEKLVKQ